MVAIITKKTTMKKTTRDGSAMPFIGEYMTEKVQFSVAYYKEEKILQCPGNKIAPGYSGHEKGKVFCLVVVILSLPLYNFFPDLQSIVEFHVAQLPSSINI